MQLANSRELINARNTHVKCLILFIVINYYYDLNLKCLFFSLFYFFECMIFVNIVTNDFMQI